jgi:hypothetical protein
LDRLASSHVARGLAWGRQFVGRVDVDVDVAVACGCAPAFRKKKEREMNILCLQKNWTRGRVETETVITLGRSYVQFDGFGKRYDQWWTAVFNFALTSSSAWPNPFCIPSFNLSSAQLVVSTQTNENKEWHSDLSWSIFQFGQWKCLRSNLGNGSVLAHEPQDSRMTPWYNIFFLKLPWYNIILREKFQN